MITRLFWRLICLFEGHLWVRRPVDPTMKRTSATVIICLVCAKELTDNPYPE